MCICLSLCLEWKKGQQLTTNHMIRLVKWTALDHIFKAVAVDVGLFVQCYPITELHSSLWLQSDNYY